MIDGEAPADAVATIGRRSRRRTETLEEILVVAVDLMRADGVGALSLSEVARRIGVRQPSLYKYFPSRIAVYDALFRLGAEQALEHFRAAAAASEPGLEALASGIDALGRWGSDNLPLAELLFWRPVPGFVPSPESYQPALDFVVEIETQLSAAVRRGQLRPEAATEQGAAVLSVLIGGAFSQHAANEPDVAYDDGRFTRLVPFLLEMFVRTYAPEGARP